MSNDMNHHIKIYRNVFLGYFNENELRTKEKSVRLETNLV